ncbi:MAG: hypothetical protein KDJ26_02125 [Alphaproteobacteria bacterium]|jgi:hypothetical protein|nr:hypothetical protein [Alphaproteobacteria bacterium]MCB1550778.1 hypothetical protein [Alphaproteobacteria bacterium]MCB9984381.1 hypothetical protein [Micavibrio sp.]HPQ50183.1 hypothetical protein [Alphaproteobacteria bacterium]HRK97853.1 hypothetical protein [Alphaproteobacteria bacterium]
MIEAANAVSSNAQLLRAVAEQTATTQSFASNPARVQAAAIVAPYLSPHVDLNGGSSKPIFVVRDAETGSHIRQFPTEGQIRAYQRAKDVQSQVQAQSQSRTTSAVEFKAEQHQADVVENSVEFRQARQEVKVAQQQSVPGANLDTGGSETKTATKTASFTDAGTSLDTKV